MRNLLRRIDRDLLTSYTHMAQDKKREFIAALLPAFLKRSALAMRREGGGDGELIYKSYGSLSLLATVTDGFLEAGRLPTSTLGVAHRVAVFDYDTEGDAMRITSILSQARPRTRMPAATAAAAASSVRVMPGGGGRSRM